MDTSVEAADSPFALKAQALNQLYGESRRKALGKLLKDAHLRIKNPNGWTLIREQPGQTGWDLFIVTDVQSFGVVFSADGPALRCHWPSGESSATGTKMFRRQREEILRVVKLIHDHLPAA